MEESPSTPSNQNQPEPSAADQIAHDVASNSALQAISSLPGAEGLMESITEGRVAETTGVEPAAAPAPTPDVAPENEPQPVAATPEIEPATPEQAPPAEQAVPESLPTSSSEPTPEPSAIDSPIFGGKKIEPGAQQQIDLTSLGDLSNVNGFLKDNFGVSDLNDLGSQISGYKDKASQYDEVLGQKSQYDELFTNMPKALYDATIAWKQGGDWKKMVTESSGMDFTKDVAAQSDKDLLKMAGKDFTEEQWDEYGDTDGDPLIKMAVNASIDLAKGQYTMKQQALTQETQRLTHNAESHVASVNDSIKSSIEHLSTAIEGVDDQYVRKIEKDMQGGVNSQAIFDVFYNADGTFKKDAAVRLVYARDGESLANQYKARTAVDIENKVTEQMLQRGSQVPTTGTGASTVEGTQNERQTEVEGHIQALTGWAESKKTF